MTFRSWKLYNLLNPCFGGSWFFPSIGYQSFYGILWKYLFQQPGPHDHIHPCSACLTPLICWHLLILFGMRPPKAPVGKHPSPREVLRLPWQGAVILLPCTSKIWVAAAQNIIKATLPDNQTWLAGQSVMSSVHLPVKTSSKPQPCSWSQRCGFHLQVSHDE